MSTPRPERDAAIVRLARNGVSRLKIAELFDLSPARISQIVTAAGYGWKSNSHARRIR